MKREEEESRGGSVAAAARREDARRQHVRRHGSRGVPPPQTLPPRGGPPRHRQDEGGPTVAARGGVTSCAHPTSGEHPHQSQRRQRRRPGGRRSSWSTHRDHHRPPPVPPPPRPFRTCPLSVPPPPHDAARRRVGRLSRRTAGAPGVGKGEGARCRRRHPADATRVRTTRLVASCAAAANRLWQPNGLGRGAAAPTPPPPPSLSPPRGRTLRLRGCARRPRKRAPSTVGGERRGACGPRRGCRPDGVPPPTGRPFVKCMRQPRTSKVKKTHCGGGEWRWSAHGSRERVSAGRND